MHLKNASTVLIAVLNWPGIYVKVPVLNVCMTVIRVDNSSETLPNEAFFSKRMFMKSASTYFDNDDYNLETLKGKKMI